MCVCVCAFVCLLGVLSPPALDLVSLSAPALKLGAPAVPVFYILVPLCGRFAFLL